MRTIKISQSKKNNRWYAVLYSGSRETWTSSGGKQRGYASLRGVIKSLEILFQCNFSADRYFVNGESWREVYSTERYQPRGRVKTIKPHIK